MWHVINVVQIVVVHPLNLFHLKLSQTSIILSSCAQEKVLRHCFKIDLYFGKTCKCCASGNVCIGMGNCTSLTVRSTFSITCMLGCAKVLQLATGYILCQTKNANKKDLLGLFFWQNISSGQKGLTFFWNYGTPKCTHGSMDSMDSME